MKASPVFFLLYLLHNCYCLAHSGSVEGPSCPSSLVRCCSAQFRPRLVGWLQHDLGYLSVFSASMWSHLPHHFMIGHLKGPFQWMNHMYLQPHAETEWVQPPVTTCQVSRDKVESFIPILQYGGAVKSALSPPLSCQLLLKSRETMTVVHLSMKSGSPLSSD